MKIIIYTKLLFKLKSFPIRANCG